MAVEDSLGVRGGGLSAVESHSSQNAAEWIPQHSICVSSQRQGSSGDNSRRQRGKKIYRIIIKPPAALGGGPQQGIEQKTGDCPQSSAQRFARA